MPTRPPEPPLTPVTVVGAGIAGLTAALALARDGHAVTVLEAAPTLSEAGAGVQLSPNATRVLRDLGLLADILPAAVKPERVRIRRGRDGRDLAEVPLGACAESRYGAPFLLIHRADLQAALAAAVTAQPAIALSLGRPVAAVTQGPERVATRLVDGTSFETAALIGADGLHSRARQVVAGDRADALRSSGRIAWRSLVPVDAAPEFAREAASALWLGPRAHLVHYPVRGGASVNVVAVVDAAGSRDVLPDDWARPGDPAELLAAFAGWCRPARALLEAAPGWRVWPLLTRPSLPRWSRGRLAVIGDAAHPMLPFLAQGAAQAIEDAAALAQAIRRAPDLPAAFDAFEKARRPQAERVVAASDRQGVVYHLAGAPALARDTAFRLLGPDRMLARYDWLYGSGQNRR